MTQKDRYAVFGNPIAHSKSPILQMAFAQQTGEPITYTAECIDTNDFRNAVDQFFADGGKGLNITVPFKEEAFRYAHQLTPRAQRAGAVNTLWIDTEQQIHGDTTDGVGLVTDIKQHLNWTINNKRVLIIGAGGAVRGILEPLIQEQPANITLVNRTVEKAHSLANDFADLFTITACAFNELTTETFDVIINGSSASLSGNLPPLPSSIVNKQSCCYDMMYAKTQTPFLKWAQQQGAKQLSDGLGMLVSQGAESFTLWREVRPDIVPVIEKIKTML